MYIGGMQTTPRRHVAAVADGRAAGHDAHAVVRRRSRAADRCPCRRTGTGRRWPPAAIRPSRKPSRMPALTHALARQRPSAPRSAARTVPALSAALSARKAHARGRLLRRGTRRRERARARPGSARDGVSGHARPPPASARPRARRASAGPAGHQRQPQHVADPAHQRPARPSPATGWSRGSWRP